MAEVAWPLPASPHRVNKPCTFLAALTNIPSAHTLHKSSSRERILRYSAGRPLSLMMYRTDDFSLCLLLLLGLSLEMLPAAQPFVLPFSDAQMEKSEQYSYYVYDYDFEEVVPTIASVIGKGWEEEDEIPPSVYGDLDFL